jgi:hypothetical protein
MWSAGPIFGIEPPAPPRYKSPPSDEERWREVRRGFGLSPRVSPTVLRAALAAVLAMLSLTHGHSRTIPLAFTPLMSLLVGCAGLTHAERGALVGTTVGALGGAVLGHQAGNTGLGTVLGAGTGMIAGTLIGDAEDARGERDAALARARAAELRAVQPPLTNADLIFMAQNGLGDEVILNAVRGRGGRFQLDPAALVELKRHGVSDRVLAQIQQTGSVVPVPAAAPVSWREPGPVVLVEPVFLPPPPPTPVGCHFSFSSGGTRRPPPWVHPCDPHW